MDNYQPPDYFVTAQRRPRYDTLDDQSYYGSDLVGRKLTWRAYAAAATTPCTDPSTCPASTCQAGENVTCVNGSCSCNGGFCDNETVCLAPFPLCNQNLTLAVCVCTASADCATAFGAGWQCDAVSGSCYPPGGTGCGVCSAACPTGTCTSGTCVNGICSSGNACGALGQPCCQTGTCTSPYVCQNNTCQMVGGQGCTAGSCPFPQDCVNGQCTLGTTAILAGAAALAIVGLVVVVASEPR